jgi:hypothetical protein
MCHDFQKYDFSDEESIDKEYSHKVKHVENSNETSTSSLLFDENDVVQSCLPPAHEFEEEIGLNDEESIDE